MDPELYGKRVGLLREVVPGLGCVRVLLSGSSPLLQPGTAWTGDLVVAGRTLGLALDVVQDGANSTPSSRPSASGVRAP